MKKTLAVWECLALRRKRAKIGKSRIKLKKQYVAWKEESSRKRERKEKNHSLQ